MTYRIPPPMRIARGGFGGLWSNKDLSYVEQEFYWLDRVTDPTITESELAFALQEIKACRYWAKKQNQTAKESE